MNTSPPPPNGPLPEAPTAAAGWYPVDGNTQRYWDGYEWTNHLAPLSHGQQFGGGALVRGVTENDRLFALIIYIGGLAFSFVVPLVMWLVKKDESPFVDFHGRQALNLHLTVFVILLFSIPLLLVGIGFLTAFFALVFGFIISIVAAVRAHSGEYYKIPGVISFF